MYFVWVALTAYCFEHQTPDIVWNLDGHMETYPILGLYVDNGGNTNPASVLTIWLEEQEEKS